MVMEVQAGLSHIGYMKKANTPTNRIGELRKVRKLTQQQLADAVGSHWITISKLERGVMRLSDEWRGAIAKALGVDEWELIVGARALPTVHVEGRIEEGGKIIPLEEEDTSEAFHLSTDYFTHPGYRWLVVAGDALWPWYQDGDRICISLLAEDEIDNARGRVCVAWYASPNGTEEVTVGILDRGRPDGNYTINRIGGPPVRNIRLSSLAVVAMVVYYLGPGSIHEPVELVSPMDLDPVR